MDDVAVLSFSTEDLRRLMRTVASRSQRSMNWHDREDVAATILADGVASAKATGIPLRALVIVGARRARYYTRSAESAARDRSLLATGDAMASTGGGVDSVRPDDAADALAMDDLVSRLPARQEAVFRLCALDKATLAEASAALNVPISTIHDDLSRAREALAAAWFAAHAA